MQNRFYAVTYTLMSNQCARSLGTNILFAFTVVSVFLILTLHCMHTIYHNSHCDYVLEWCPDSIVLQTTIGIHVRLSHTGGEATDYGCTSHASIIQCNWKWHCAVNGHQSKSYFLTCWSRLPVCSGYLSNIQGPSPVPFEASSAKAWGCGWLHWAEAFWGVWPINHCGLCHPVGDPQPDCLHCIITCVWFLSYQLSRYITS